MRRIIPVLLAMLLLAGCKTYQPCLVDGTAISNPTLGFEGITFAFPEDYHQIFERQKPPITYGQVVWNTALSSVHPIGHYTEEILIFEKTNIGISFEIIKIAKVDNFSRVSDHIIEELMTNVADWFKFTTGEVLYRESESINGHWTAKIARQYTANQNDLVTVIYVIPGTLKELYVFTGLTHPSMQKTLENDLKTIISSFAFQPFEK